MSDKSSLMPSIDYVPFHEVIEAVEKSLQLD
ncbi:AcrF10 family anti-CRISPR protein [Pseudoalteromonas sp. HL-AS1]|nr:AcrF10 family anti-CRISPR protein [Pseudoalteromonas sp. HL-AS1]WMS90243.1 AcrF10 family anti-CRISPR protein [Pseudoalteromonas sp. HL-AS1]